MCRAAARSDCCFFAPCINTLTYLLTPCTSNLHLGLHTTSVAVHPAAAAAATADNDEDDVAERRRQAQRWNGAESPPMDFDSDEETLLRLPHDVFSHG